MKRPSIKYGLISGGVMVLLVIIPFLIFDSLKMKSAFKMAEILGYTIIILSLLFVFFGIRSYRDTELGGVISFGKAFVSGIIITAIASLIFAVFNIILYKYIAPNLQTEMMDYYKESIINSGQPKDIIDKQLAQMDSQKDFFNNVYLQGVIMFFTVFPLGLIISLISSLILKRKNPKTQTA